LHEKAAKIIPVIRTRRILFLFFILLRLDTGNYKSIDCPKHKYDPQSNPELFRNIFGDEHTYNNKKSAEKKDGGYRVRKIF